MNEDEIKYKIDFLFGGINFIPPVYSLVEKKETYLWFFSRTVYFIECDIGSSTGPFSSLEAAMQCLYLFQNPQDYRRYL